MKRTKYIFVTGGVVSGLGKGITAASLGRLLKNRGYKVTIQKIDPYLNVEPGLLSPIEHGEVFVTEDGTETDLDLGHYERFIDENLTRNSSISMGKVYLNVLNKESRGEYQGKTVQVIPHVTNAIKDKIYSFENTDIDIVITEIGGTIGDIESLSIVEAMRQVGFEKPQEDVEYIHVTLLPYIYGSNEIKTKPTQHSVRELQSLGIKPNIIVCRTETEITDTIKEKLALFCNVRKESVIENRTADNLYAIPLLLEQEGLANEVCKDLKLEKVTPHNEEWIKMINEIRAIGDETVNVAIIGKYTALEDSYLSLMEGLRHAGYRNKVNVNIKLIDSSKVNTKNIDEKLKNMHAIIIPSGDGAKGQIGEILTIKYARENKIPFLGIGLGMQTAVIEFARNVLNLQNANSTEIDKNTEYPVITITEEQRKMNDRIREMRIGAYPCNLKANSVVKKLYNTETISERHRHKFEFNNKYKNEIEKAGLICSGISPDGNFVEIVELINHSYFIGVEFQPELASRPNKPAPILVGLIEAAKYCK